MSFDRRSITSLRRFVAEHAMSYGLGSGGTEDLVLATNEIATNSLRHGGGKGALRMWTSAQAVISEIRDGGRIDDPLVGRVKPRASDGSRFGIWLANALCDLVQVRSSAARSVVRLHMSLDPEQCRGADPGATPRGETVSAGIASWDQVGIGPRSSPESGSVAVRGQ